MELEKKERAVGTSPLLPSGRPAMQREAPGEGEPININEKNGCDQRMLLSQRK